jgi:hypothetical protein
MNSTPSPIKIAADDVAVAALKQAYEQIGRADRQVPLADKQVPKPKQNAPFQPSDRQKRLAGTGRASLVRLALKGLIGLVLAACLGAAAIAWQSHGDAVKAIFASRASQSDLTSSLAPKNLDAEKTSPPAVQATATRAARPQPTFLAQMAPEGAAPTNAALWRAILPP